MNENNKLKKNNIEEFVFTDFLNGFVKINQHLVQNYFKNYSGYYYDNRNVWLTYNFFFTKLFTEPKEMVKVQDFYSEFLQKQQSLLKNIAIDQYAIKHKNEKEPIISPKKGDN